MSEKIVKFPKIVKSKNKYEVQGQMFTVEEACIFFKRKLPNVRNKMKRYKMPLKDALFKDPPGGFGTKEWRKLSDVPRTHLLKDIPG